MTGTVNRSFGQRLPSGPGKLAIFVVWAINRPDRNINKKKEMM
ncbi:MAG: hypothetical protein ACM3PX_06640 [Omnitrophica WOR_2 bacterium]